MTRIAVAAEVLAQVQSLIDERTRRDDDRAAAIQLIDVDSDETATAEAALRWGLDAAAFGGLLARAPASGGCTVRGPGSRVGRSPRSPTAASR